jgi:poly-gamma-glutamate capsule biosynthesis protein CapA/YwtB (metallophosphatase superfamily)
VKQQPSFRSHTPISRGGTEKSPSGESLQKNPALLFLRQVRFKMSFLFLFVSILVCSATHAQDTTRLSLLFAGDIMGHDSQIAAAYDTTTKVYDYTSCFRFVKPYLESVDVAIGNLELTLAGAPYKGYPAFSSPDALAVALQAAGFDALVTANNHSCDKGKKGIERTIDVLDSLGIYHTGTFIDHATRLNDYPVLVEKNGFTLALLNYTYGTNGIAVPKPTIVNLIDTTQMAEDIRRAKDHHPDFIIAFMHWGREYEPLPDAFQKNITAFLFDKGVPLVIGAHPHVLQPMEFDKEKQQLVVYSLGNFVSGQRDRYKNGGAMVRVDISKVKTDSSEMKSIDSVQYILQYVHRDAYRKYVVLPVPSFENDTTGFVKGEAAQQSLKIFIEDARALLDKNNQQVFEWKRGKSLKIEE